MNSADRVIVDTFIATACHTCKRVPPDVTLQKCMRCEMVWYCGRACQKKDWSLKNTMGHRTFCAHLGTMRRRVRDAARAEEAAARAAAATGPAGAGEGGAHTLGVPSLFRPSTADSLGRYKLGCLQVLEDVLQRPACDLESLPVLFQRHCAHCMKLYDEDEDRSSDGDVPGQGAETWETCEKCSAMQWCCTGCRSAEAAQHLRSCSQYKLGLDCAREVTKSITETQLPPFWMPPLRPMHTPLPTEGWQQFFTDTALQSPGCSTTGLSNVEKCLAAQDLGLPFLVLWSLEQCGIRHRDRQHRSRQRLPLPQSGGGDLSERKRLVVHVVDPAAEDCLGLRRWAAIFSRLPGLECIDLLMSGPNIRPDTVSESIVPEQLQRRKTDPPLYSKPASMEPASMAESPAPESGLDSVPWSASSSSSSALHANSSSSLSRQLVRGHASLEEVPNDYQLDGTVEPAGQGCPPMMQHFLPGGGNGAGAPPRTAAVNARVVAAADMSQKSKNCMQILHELCQKMKFTCQFVEQETAPFQMDVTVHGQDRVPLAVLGIACQTKKGAKNSAAEAWLLCWNRTFQAASPSGGDAVTTDSTCVTGNISQATQHSLASEPRIGTNGEDERGTAHDLIAPAWAIARLNEFLQDPLSSQLPYDADSLSPDQRNLVRMVALEHGLTAKSRGKGKNRHLVLEKKGVSGAVCVAAIACDGKATAGTADADNADNAADADNADDADAGADADADAATLNKRAGQETEDDIASQVASDKVSPGEGTADGWGQPQTLDNFEESDFVDASELRQQWAAVKDLGSRTEEARSPAPSTTAPAMSNWERPNEVVLAEGLSNGLADGEFEWLRGAFDRSQNCPKRPAESGKEGRKAETSPNVACSRAATGAVENLMAPEPALAPLLVSSAEPEPEHPAEADVTSESEEHATDDEASDGDEDKEDGFMAEYRGLDSVEILCPIPPMDGADFGQRRRARLRVAYYMGAYSDLVGVRGFATPDVMLCAQPPDLDCHPDTGAVIGEQVHWGLVLSTLASTESATLMLFPTTTARAAADIELWVERRLRTTSMSHRHHGTSSVLPPQPNPYGSLRPLLNSMASNQTDGSQFSYSWNFVVATR
eukprot:SAG22_NODE_1262_length_4968_cov_18.197750_2_plen_1108_part_00